MRGVTIGFSSVFSGRNRHYKGTHEKNLEFAGELDKDGIIGEIGKE